MSPVDYFIRALTTDFANFKGRARRSEFWYYILFTTLSLIAMFATFMRISYEAGIISLLIAYLVTFVPTLAIYVRRLHDTGKTGWLVLLLFVPAGSIVLMILACIDSDPGENKYGYNPKEEEDMYDMEDILT